MPHACESVPFEIRRMLPMNTLRFGFTRGESSPRSLPAPISLPGGETKSFIPHFRRPRGVALGMTKGRGPMPPDLLKLIVRYKSVTSATQSCAGNHNLACTIWRVS